MDIAGRLVPFHGVDRIGVIHHATLDVFQTYCKAAVGKDSRAVPLDQYFVDRFLGCPEAPEQAVRLKRCLNQRLLSRSEYPVHETPVLVFVNVTRLA